MPTLLGSLNTNINNGIGLGDEVRGTWGLYPFLPSGLILASDIGLSFHDEMHERNQDVSRIPQNQQMAIAAVHQYFRQARNHGPMRRYKLTIARPAKIPQTEITYYRRQIAT